MHASGKLSPSLGIPTGRSSDGGAQHAVFHFENSIEDVQCPVVVRHDDDPGLLLVCDHAEQLHHLASPMAVEGGGGLVGQYQVGLFASARATATRCCWPPESAEGGLPERSATPR